MSLFDIPNRSNRRRTMLIVLCYLLVVNMTIYASTNEAGHNEQTTSWLSNAGNLSALIGFILLIIAIVITAIIKSRRRSPQSQPTPQQFRESYFSGRITESILENLRSGNRQNFRLALVLVANCAVYEEEIITELGKIIGKQPPYDKIEWLNSIQRCLFCRFLHLVLERNRASEFGKRFDNGVDFDSIYSVSQSSYCTIRGVKKGFIYYLGREILPLLGRKVKDLF